ncbi:MAG TPA: FMN-binding negative transcriptional regulator, partial [Stellaceae bacterium]|nr:FMN-binding negative transcriptional regulator [Stellaceae bacterium]
RRRPASNCLATNRRLTGDAPVRFHRRNAGPTAAREVDMVYLPKHFTEADPAVLAEIMERNSFATLISHGKDGLIASQLPFMYERAAGPHGTLLCHLARPNPQVADLKEGREVLVVFAGPHAYVSPNWYEKKPAVPTWNYVAVHAYGTPRVIEDSGDLTRLVGDLAELHEGGRKAPWRLADEPADYAAGMVRGIIGFAIPIARLQGKFKLSQNRSPADRSRVVAALRGENHQGATDVAALMESRETQPAPAK